MKKIVLLLTVLFLFTQTNAQKLTQRLPIHEVFTSSTCGPCYSGNISIQSILDANPNKFTLIKYQMNWPGVGDPYYTTEGGYRRGLYGVNSVPSLFVDGHNYNVGSYNQTQFNNNYNKPVYLEISATHSIIGKTVEVIVTLNPLQDFSGTKNKVFIAIVENKTTGNKMYNGETEFYSVMKKMLPKAIGRPLGNLTNGTPVSFTESYTFPSVNTVEEFYDLSVVVWAQNTTTKEVYQSAWSFKTAGINNNNNPNNGIISLFPNPVSSSAFVKYIVNNNQDVEINIYNILGEKVYTDKKGVLQNGIHTSEINCENLENGFYILKLTIGNTVFLDKLNVLN